MSTEQKKRREPSRKLQSAQAQSRKERYRKDDGEPEFTLAEKLSYFIRKGGPWVIGAVLLVGGIAWTVSTIRESIRPDQLSAEHESEARKLIANAAKLERQGDIYVAAAELEALVRRYPTSMYRQYAEELLERHRKGEKMFAEEDGEDGLARISERLVRNTGELAQSSPTGERRGRRNRQQGEAELAPSESPATPPKPVEFPPDEPVAQTIEEALNKPAAIKLVTGKEIRPLPEGFMIQGTAVHESGWPAVILCVADQSEMVFVPAGPVRIGNDQGPENERPAHVVNVPGFYVDRSEVTWASYRAFLKANPDHPKPAATPADLNTPVTGVSYKDALAYCTWAKKELPSEVQWEKAARGPQSNLYPWGNHRETAPMPTNDKSLSAPLTRPADRSPYGVFDLAGNAAEWCSDWYSANAYQSALSTSETKVLAITTPERVIRGGSPEWSVTWRESKPESATEPWLGFRGVLVVSDAQAEVVQKPTPESDSKAEGSRGGRSGRARTSVATTPIMPPTGTATGTRGARSRQDDAATSRPAPVTGDRPSRSPRGGDSPRAPVASPGKAPERGTADRDSADRET